MSAAGSTILANLNRVVGSGTQNQAADVSYSVQWYLDHGFDGLKIYKGRCEGQYQYDSI